jgi:hypothetical protein
VRPDEQRLQPDAFHRTGLVGHGVAGCCQRAGQGADPEHLRRLRLPGRPAVESGGDTAAGLRLQGVGDRQREQTTDRVGAASIDQPVDPLGANHAARRIVDEDPVLALGAVPDQRGKAVRDGSGARRTAAPNDAKPTLRGKRYAAFERFVVRCQHDEDGLQSIDLSQRCKGVGDHRPARDRHVLLRQAGPGARSGPGAWHQREIRRPSPSRHGRRPKAAGKPSAAVVFERVVHRPIEYR